MVSRSQARRRWRALFALTILVGLVGGLALALIAGSRRSSSVVARYAAAARHYDVQVSASSITRAQLLAIPGVVRADTQAYVATNVVPRGGHETAGVNGNVVVWSATDPTNQILEGRIPDGHDPLQIVVNREFVRQFGYSVGDRIPMRMFGLDQGDEVDKGVYRPQGPEYVFEIAAVARTAQDIVSGDAQSLGTSAVNSRNQIFVSDAFYHAHRDEFLDFGSGAYVQLADGEAGVARFSKAVRSLVPAGADAPLFGPVPPLNRKVLADPVGLETMALLALGVGISLAGAIAVALLLRVEQRAVDADTPTLRALGCTRRQLGTAAALRALPVAMAGAGIAFALAIALSSRFPIGIGGEIELDPGTRVNVAVVGLGTLAIVLFVLGCAFAFGRPRRPREEAPARTRGLADRLAGAGAPADLTIAAHLAFDRARGARRTPSRPAMAGGAVLLAILCAVGVYVSGVDDLYGSRASHGFAWDAAVGNTNFPLTHAARTRLSTDPQFAASTFAQDGVASVNGKATDFLAFDPKGTAPPVVVTGHLPAADDEVALGRQFMRDLGVHLGSTVELSLHDQDFGAAGDQEPRRMRVVGEALDPAFGNESDIGQGGLVTLAGVRAAGGRPAVQLALTRLRDGPTTAAYQRLDRAYTQEIATDYIPARVVNLHRVRGVPLLGVAVAAILGTFLLVYALIAGVRLRTRELAVLRALGLSSRRLRRVLAWQGSLLATGMVVIGVPAGLVLGAALWARVADGLGIGSDVTVSPWLLVVAPLLLAVAIAASIVPARRARRESVAALLRVE